MDWLRILIETLSVSYSTIIKIVYIVIPIFILLECLKDTGWLEKISRHSQGLTKPLKLPGETAFGLAVGLVIGLVFGSGVILQIKEEVQMTRQQLNVLFIFLGICHGVIEETVLFTAIGAYGGVLLTTRILLAIFFTFAYIYMVQWIERLYSRRHIAKIEQ